MEKQKDRSNEQPILVWYGLKDTCDKIILYAAAIKAIRSYFSNSINQTPFFYILFCALYWQLHMEVFKMFEKAETCGNTNCSMAMLKGLCVKDERHFPKKENEPLMLWLDELEKEYERIFSKTLRDKYLAHSDLAARFVDSAQFTSDFEEICRFVSKVQVVIDGLLAALVGVNGHSTTIDELEKVFLDTLAKINVSGFETADNDFQKCSN